MKNLKVIYQPQGRAREYSEYAVNLYTGCIHKCSYCYVPRKIFPNIKNFHENVIPRRNILQNLLEDCYYLSRIEKRKISNVLLCFTCDPYQQDKNLITREALKILKEYSIPFTILTKGGVRAVVDFDLYSSQDFFGVTLTCVNNSLLQKYEPFAESFESRLEALKEAKRLKIQTWVSLEPVLSISETIKAIQLSVEYVDCFKIGKLNYYKDNINWQKELRRIIELLKELKKDFYIKKELQQYIG